MIVPGSAGWGLLALLYARFLVTGSPFRGRGGLLYWVCLGWKWGGVGVPGRRGSTSTVLVSGVKL